MLRQSKLCGCRFIATVLVTAAVLTGSATAAQIRMDQGATIDESDRIVVGQVIDSLCHWNEEHTLILTDYTVAVKETLKGASSDSTLIVTVMGGTVDGLSLFVTEEPRFAVNETVIVHVRAAALGRLEVVHGTQGKFTVVSGVISETGQKTEEYAKQVTARLEKQREEMK